jgi:hypothetical protein
MINKIDMRKLLLFLGFLLFTTVSFCQAQTAKKYTSKAKTKDIIAALSGQWHGFFDSKGDIVAAGGDNTEYVLELDINGKEVSGYSYSYFQNRSYYVICSLAGEFDKATKSLKVTETARIKGLTPPGWNDCLQTHILTYKKEGPTEVLSGKWKMADGQFGDCGFGTTTLTKRTLSNSLASYNKSKSNVAFSGPKHTIKPSNIITQSKRKPALVKNNSKPSEPVTEPQFTGEPVIKDTPETIRPTREKIETLAPVDAGFEKRNNTLLQTIKIQNETIRVDLYDNGVVDGDSVSLFYNGKLILSHQRLSEKAITLTLNVNTNKAINDLTMYADNLGEIPPNTALMVVTDGDNRYEVPVTSDLKNSGTIRFIYNGKKG